MKVRTWWRWGVVLVPVTGGLVVSTLIAEVITIPNPILYLRADLATVSLLVGGILSALLMMGLLLVQWSERREAQNIVGVRAKALEERRRFLRRLDHELKNPLTAIRAGLTNITSSNATPGQQQALESVETQVLRLSRLTSDLRKLAELESRPLERDSINIAELVQEAVTLAQEKCQAETRHLNLTLPQAPWPVPDVLGDWDLLFLAIYNLLDNAFKFTRPGDTIEIRASEDGTFVVIEVADTGPGIPQEELPRVWEELYRGQGARGIPGSGLGLALVRAIVERHGGQISLRSRPKQGTVVRMRLPIQ